jgi:two-component system, sporulation sensor kinase B
MTNDSSFALFNLRKKFQILKLDIKNFYGGYKMLAEKLFLNLLITLSPVLLYSVLSDNNKKLKSLYMCGLLQSLAALACITFSYTRYGFGWDLRYVPLILSILYGGPIAGGIVFTSIVILRVALGGHTILFGVMNSVLIALIPFLITKKFWTFSPNKRVTVSFLVGFWPILVCYFSLNAYRFIHAELKLEFLPDLLLFALLQTVAIALAAKLNEGIIERSKMKEEILRSEKLNTLGELAASIAHEIRNPLTVVKGFLQLMQKEEKGKYYEYLTLVLNELGRAEGIINDYLNFAKPKFEKIEEFSITEVLTEVSALLEPLATKQGVQLLTPLDEEEFILHTDRNQLKQALVNLIKNAIEATSEGGQVTLKYKQENNNASISISDNGKGMTSEQLTRIGTLFYTTKEKGTGLGTSVSLRIIETMNGKVTYSSKLGEGTEVIMILPETKSVNI